MLPWCGSGSLKARKTFQPCEGWVAASVSSRTETWVSISVRTDIGLRRTGNEDNLQVVDLTGRRLGLTHRESPLSREVAQHRLGKLGTLLIVSDGMGGAAAGEVASEMAVDIVAREMLHQVHAGVPSHEAMRKAADSANAAIWERSQNESAIRGLGATLTAVHLYGQEATISQVGDSRAYLIREGTIRQLTEDQSWANAVKKSGVAGQVVNVPNNVILQALGTQRVVNTEITTEVIHPNDIFLLCSDGLSNKVEEHELLSYVVGAASLDAAAETLVKLANDRGGEDNITVVIARLFTVDDPDTISESRATQLLTSEPSGENRLPVGAGRTTSDLLGAQPTLSNFTVTTQSNRTTTTMANATTDLTASTSSDTTSAVETPVPPTTPLPQSLSRGGKLFVLLALVAVGVIVLAGVAAMIWVLQSRAERERTGRTEPRPYPVLSPIGLPSAAPETPSLAPPPDGPGNSGGIEQADGVSLDSVEKELDQIEQQVQNVERRLDQIPGQDAERQSCKEKSRQLATLKEALKRHRQQQARPDDPSVKDIQKEVHAISQWLDTLPSPLREMKAPGNHPLSSPVSPSADELQRTVERTVEKLVNNASQSTRHP